MLKNLSGSLLPAIAFLLIINGGCTKIDTTTLGSDLIPAVDNVHTFADTLGIIGTQGIFNDSTKIGRTDYHVLGSISNDPVFGKTSADLYLELKPSFFPYFFGNANDTINNSLAPGTGFDSVVLCLTYKSFYGDTTVAQNLKVYQIGNTTSDFIDSSYRLNYTPNGGLGNLIGSKNVIPSSVRGFTVFQGSVKDSVNNQIRIKLDNSFLQQLTSNRDTTTTGNGMYLNDSIFKSKIKGLAIIADPSQGNGLFYIGMDDATTRLEFHYKKKNNNKLDTTFSSFYFSTGISFKVSASAQATNFKRDRTGAEISSPSNDVLYIQSTPGTYANLTIPALNNFPNSIVHRAEISFEQIPTTNPIDAALTPPLYMYLDLIDSSSSSGVTYKPVYYDLSPNAYYNPDNSVSFFPSNGIDFSYFGGTRRVKADAAGKPQYFYTFNLSRYVQNLITKRGYSYSFRMYAPYNLHYHNFVYAFNNNLANGRVKIGNGNNANFKMSMRLVYSKL